MRQINTEDAHEMLVSILIWLALFGALWAAGSILGPREAEDETKCEARAN